jgi:hypothetical protein
MKIIGHYYHLQEGSAKLTVILSIFIQTDNARFWCYAIEYNVEKFNLDIRKWNFFPCHLIPPNSGVNVQS